MSLEFQQVQEQVRRLGESALQREQRLRQRRTEVADLLAQNARNLDALREKVLQAARDPKLSLRCALPVAEPLDSAFPLPPMPAGVTVLAADGSQISLDRHAEVEYGLVNVGAIQMRYGSPDPPGTKVTSRLLYDELLTTPTGALTEATLALMRDVSERSILADLAQTTSPPVVALCDGPVELWGVREGGEAASEFQRHLVEYLEALSRLEQLGVATAGYVDKPGANLVVRLLEVFHAPASQMAELRKYRPFQGVSDRSLFAGQLAPGERSALFALQSQSAANYRGSMELHFFYLNVGREGSPYVARVELPQWVAASRKLLDALHAVLVDQCRMMAARPYPYVLQRAHETALVSLQEKEQVTQMIALELRRRGVPVGVKSHKQSGKDLEGRTGFKP